MSNKKPVSKNLVYRLPIYLTISQRLLEEGAKYITAPQISEITGINVETVKKDLSQICKTPGNPKLGREAGLLVEEILEFGVYTKVTSAILIGVGHLGKALLHYGGFKEWGLDIAAGFDRDPSVVGTLIDGKKIYANKEMPEVIEATNAEIAIITVPKEYAQQLADFAIAAGIRAIWNFAPTHLSVPDDVILQNENMASSLSLLNYNLKASKGKKKTKKRK